MSFFLPGTGGPLAKLGAFAGVVPVSHGDNGVQVVMFDLPAYLPLAFPLNYRVILGICPGGELTLFVDVFQVQADVINTSFQQLCQLSLGQPDGFLVQQYLNIPLAGFINGNVKVGVGHIISRSGWSVLRQG